MLNILVIWLVRLLKGEMVKKKKKVKIKKNTLDNTVHQLEDRLARALADYDNLRKRFEREKDKFLQFANKGLIAEFLGIYDMLVTAQEHVKDSGIAIILEEYKRILQDEHVEEIEAKEGEKFDEDVHDAVEIIEGSEKNSGKIAEVMLTGWKYIDGPIVRPVKVKVYKKNEK